MNKQSLPLGKLPAPILTELLDSLPANDPRVLLGPQVGLDCAVIEIADRLLVLKSDPITFTSDDIGYYLVQVNANDIATTGGIPRWMLLTYLLPVGSTTAGSVADLFQQVAEAAGALGITIVGGHTEITHGIDRVLAVGTLIGEVENGKLVTPRGAEPGHRILLTKGIAVEATAIAAKEFADQLAAQLTELELEEARRYLFEPGLSVVRDAQVATAAGAVSAMHDPTEGGLAAALWELAAACEQTLVVDVRKIPMSKVTQKICEILAIEPMAAISSGALLLTSPPEDSQRIIDALLDSGILCVDIGHVEPGPSQVFSESGSDRLLLPWPERDEIARLLES